METNKETLEQYMRRRLEAFNKYIDKRVDELGLTMLQFAENTKLQEDIAAKFDNDVWLENYYEDANNGGEVE